MTSRQSSSAILVPATPTQPNHAASKSYVDSSISSATSGINVSMDHVTGLNSALASKVSNTIFDKAGEILASSAANTPAIVTAPTADGQLLKSASAQAAGALWAAGAPSDVGLGNVNNTADSTKSVASAATLTTPRAINGVNFDGSAAITINAVDSTAREPAIAAGTTSQYWRGDKSWQALTQDVVPDGTTNKAYSASDKTRLANTSGTNTGDQTSVTGNAGTATKLATARAINGVNFDGSAAITVADSTKVPLAGGTMTGLLVLSANPTAALGAAPKQYVDNLTQRNWCPEANICQGTLATGYNDLPGGFAVEPGPNANGILLDSVWVRLGTYSATAAAQCVFDFYVGTATTIGSSIAVSVTLASGANNVIGTLGTSLAVPANSVIRVNCSTAGSGVTGPIHCQLRGRYAG